MDHPISITDDPYMANAWAYITDDPHEAHFFATVTDFLCAQTCVYLTDERRYANLIIYLPDGMPTDQKGKS